MVPARSRSSVWRTLCARLFEIQRLDAVRRARHLRALHLESFPEPAPHGVVERIGDALRS